MEEEGVKSYQALPPFSGRFIMAVYNLRNPITLQNGLLCLP